MFSSSRSFSVLWVEHQWAIPLKFMSSRRELTTLCSGKKLRIQTLWTLASSRGTNPMCIIRSCKNLFFGLFQEPAIPSIVSTYILISCGHPINSKPTWHMFEVITLRECKHKTHVEVLTCLNITYKSSHAGVFRHFNVLGLTQTCPYTKPPITGSQKICFWFLSNPFLRHSNLLNIPHNNLLYQIYEGYVWYVSLRKVPNSL